MTSVKLTYIEEHDTVNNYVKEYNFKLNGIPFNVKSYNEACSKIIGFERVSSYRVRIANDPEYRCYEIVELWET